MKQEESSLKLVVVGHGSTAGRKPHLIRIRETLRRDLKTVCQGQMYLLIEIALQRLVDDLKQRQGQMQVITAESMDASQEDIDLVEMGVKSHPKNQPDLLTRPVGVLYEGDTPIPIRKPRSKSTDKVGIRKSAGKGPG